MQFTRVHYERERIYTVVLFSRAQSDWLKESRATSTLPPLLRLVAVFARNRKFISVNGGIICSFKISPLLSRRVGTATSARH